MMVVGFAGPVFGAVPPLKVLKGTPMMRAYSGANFQVIFLYCLTLSSGMGLPSLSYGDR